MINYQSDSLLKFPDNFLCFFLLEKMQMEAMIVISTNNPAIGTTIAMILWELLLFAATKTKHKQFHDK